MRRHSGAIQSLLTIPNNVPLRWTARNNGVTVFHDPSGYSNGNPLIEQAVDYQCAHGVRRGARYKINRPVTIGGGRFEGRRLSSPNDGIVHPNDESLWITNPTFGAESALHRVAAQSWDDG